MVVTGQPETWVDGIRFPAIKGLPKDTVVLPHNSLVHIARMRRSIEVAERQLERARAAVWESQRLLVELRKDGF